MKSWIMVLKAADAAARWHVHQRRKGAAKEPYINYLLEVATLVAEATDGKDLDLVVAALLHDAIARTSPAPGSIPEHASCWSCRRASDIEWARKVVAGLRGANAMLEKQFDEAAWAAEQSIVPSP
jgi:hypothetical protein